MRDGQYLMIHIARSRDGKQRTPGNMAGAIYGGSQIRREPDMAGADEKGLSRLALLVYVLWKEYPIVESYACRDHRSIQHTIYVYLGVPPAVKNMVSYWCAHKTGACVCDTRHCEAWSGSCQDFPVPDGI